MAIVEDVLVYHECAQVFEIKVTDLPQARRLPVPGVRHCGAIDQQTRLA